MLFPKCYNSLIDKNIVESYLSSSEDEPKNEVLRKQIIKKVAVSFFYAFENPIFF